MGAFGWMLAAFVAGGCVGVLLVAIMQWLEVCPEPTWHLRRRVVRSRKRLRSIVSRTALDERAPQGTAGPDDVSGHDHIVRTVLAAD